MGDVVMPGVSGALVLVCVLHPGHQMGIFLCITIFLRIRVIMIICVLCTRCHINKINEYLFDNKFLRDMVIRKLDLCK